MRSFATGEILFPAEAIPRHIFLIDSGQVRLLARGANGKSVVLSIARSGELLGISGVMSGLRSPVSAEAALPSEVRLVPADTFRGAIRGAPELSVWFADQLSRELHRAWDHSRILALGDAQAKLAYLLFSWAETQAHALGEELRLPVPFNQQEMSDAAGLSRETLNRSLSNFRRLGLIRMERGSLVLCRLNELRALLAV